MEEEFLHHRCNKCKHKWLGNEFDLDCPRCDGDAAKAYAITVLQELKNDPPIPKPEPMSAAEFKKNFRVIGGPSW